MLPRGRPDRPERAAFFAFSRLALSLASVMGRRWRMAGTLGSVGFIRISQRYFPNDITPLPTAHLFAERARTRSEEEGTHPVRLQRLPPPDSRQAQWP